MGVLFLRLYAHRSRGKPALADLLNLQPHRQPQGRDTARDGAGVHAGIDQRAQRHIAADAAKAVEVSHAHVCLSPSL